MCGKEMIKRHAVVVIVFVVCSIVFLYKSGECIYKFSLHETVTKVDVVPPQKYPQYPLPKICILLGFNTTVLESLNITKQDYIHHGLWRNEKNKSENEEEFYNRLSNEYSHVIKKINVKVNTGSGDGYTKNTIYENASDIKMWKMEQYCEHYRLKCICIFIKPNFIKKGIQEINISLKKSKN